MGISKYDCCTVFHSVNIIAGTGVSDSVEAEATFDQPESRFAVIYQQATTCFTLLSSLTGKVPQLFAGDIA